MIHFCTKFYSCIITKNDDISMYGSNVCNFPGLLDLYTWKSSCLLPVGMNSRNDKTVGCVSGSRDKYLSQCTLTFNLFCEISISRVKIIGVP